MWMSWGEKCEVERRAELEEKEEGNEADRKDEKGRRRGKKILSAINGSGAVLCRRRWRQKKRRAWVYRIKTSSWGGVREEDEEWVG